MCPEYLPGITDEPTTYRDDYRPHKLSRAHVEKKRANENISEPRKTVRPIAESHDTFQKLDYESRLPFDALWRTKEIVGNSGKTLPSRSTPEVEPGEDYANRPKIELVSPAVDLNELKDPEARKFVVDFIYKTTVTQAAEEVWPDFKNITDKTSLSTDTIENRSDPIPLKVKLKPDIPASYKRAARRWDFLQDRTLVDPPKACPERSAIYRSTVSEKIRKAICYHQGIYTHVTHALKAMCNILPPTFPVLDCPVEADEYLLARPENRWALDRSLNQSGSLRLPYEKVHISYGGHRTPVALGVPLEKKKVSIYHPDLTVSQALYSRRC